MSDQEGFVGWAVVELFGHKRMAGHVSSQAVAGGSMVRIDVPETPADMRPMTPAYTKLVGVAAVYGITPVSEEIARRAAREIERWNDPLPVQLPALAAPVGTEIDPNFVDDEDDDDEDYEDEDEDDEERAS